jgi:dihydrolipoamide dehydrogenase
LDNQISKYDVIVMGSGPGGYVAAIRAGQLGMKTALIEKSELGGVCLNWGCIPSKSLLRNAEVLNLINEADKFGIEVSGVEADFSKAITRSREVVSTLTQGIGYLLKKNKVDIYEGTGSFENENTIVVGSNQTKIEADNIVVATGARQRDLPGINIDGDIVITSRHALELNTLPKSVVIIGGGATGAEFAYLYRSYGVEVTIVEMMDRILPLEDQDVSTQLTRSFKKKGISIITSSQVQSISSDNGTALVAVKTESEELNIECEKVLVAVGVQPNSDQIGLDQTQVETKNGFIVIDDHMKTNVSGIYAIGDITGKLLLAHVASEQGVIAIENIAGLDNATIDYSLMPRAVYCRPQVASFGLTEAQARETGREIKIGKFPLSASGKALALSETEGFIKVVSDAEIGDILGVHMIGAEVTELLGEAGMTKMLEGTTTELGSLVHPHPTISECLKEAGLATENLAIHM